MGWLKDKFSGIAKTFMGLLPDGGGQNQGVTDEALVIKTSPTIWEYEMFRLEWDRRTVLREIDLMLKSDTRIKRANHVFASTAVRKGITITCSSAVSENIGSKAQEVINDLMRDCQVNAKLPSWGRILLKDGDLFLNPIVDIKARKIKNIKRLPGITMQRNDDMTGNFTDIEKAFQQIDPISLEVLMEFPLWAINHIRYDHEEGDRYGNSQYLACRGYWKKLNMTEEDLVVRRRTRAPLRRLHSIGNKDNPADWSEVEKYKSTNGLDNPKRAQITTDYYGNGLTDVKNLQGDDKVDQIADVDHLQEVYMIGTGVPLEIMGFGQNVTHNGPVDVQADQFKEDCQELRTLLEYGDSSPYSGLRFIFDFALALAGINPLLVDYNIRWFEDDNETANDRVDRVIKLRSAQPDPLISKKTAITIVSKDIGLENEASIEAEINAIKEEMQEDKTEQQTLEGGLNPEKPSTASISRSTVSSSGRPVTDNIITDSKKKQYYFPLHGEKMNTLEKNFTKVIKSNFQDIYESVSLDLKEFVSKIDTLRSVYNDAQTPKLVEQILEMFNDAWTSDKESIKNDFFKTYLGAADYARSNAAKDIKIDIPKDFVNPDVQKYFLTQAGERIDGIHETTLDTLRNQLFVAYTNKETPKQWEARIEKVLNCDSPKGRAEMIARTELSWAYNQGLKATYKEVGTHKVRWLAVLDNRTCPTCRDNHDQIFDLNELPDIPAHPRCRCTIVGADDFSNNTNTTTQNYSNNGASNNENSDIIKNIKNELKTTGVKGEINIPAKDIDVNKLGFDENHVNNERHHNVTEEDAKEYIKNAKISISKWKGKFENYYSENGVTYVNMETNTIRTAYEKKQFGKDIEAILEVLKKYGK